MDGIFSKITITRLIASAVLLCFGMTLTTATAMAYSQDFYSDMFAAKDREREERNENQSTSVRRKKTVRAKARQPKVTRKAAPVAAPKKSAKKVAPVAPKVPAPAPEVEEAEEQETQETTTQSQRTQKVPVAPEKMDAKMHQFSHIKANGKIAKEPFRKALAFYAQNQHKFSNHRYIGVIDFTKNSSQERFCMINLKTGSTDCMKTSHGIGSDGGGGRATRFSNRPNSHASSIGYYKTLATYSGKHGTSLRMDGLSNTNSNALKRAIVIHGARYVKEGTRSVSGRSHGCPALDNAIAQNIIHKLKGGALIYAWHADHN